MPILKTVSTQISDLQGRYIMDVEEGEAGKPGDADNKYQHLPYGDYLTYTPLIGEMRALTGKKEQIPSEGPFAEDIMKILETIHPIILFRLRNKSILDAPIPEDLIIACKKIGQEGLTQGTYQLNFLDQLCFNLASHYQPWDRYKGQILSLYKPIFSAFIQYGAQIKWLEKEDEGREQRYRDIQEYALDEEAINLEFSKTPLSQDDTGFGKFEKNIAWYLKKGANINTKSWFNPFNGSFLQIYLANELPYADQLIACIESQRTAKPNTQFHYDIADGYGNTPLLLALKTRQEKAIFALLKLNKKITVGINIPDANGLSPLMIAAALGMKAVVQELLRQGANPCVYKEGRDLAEYARLNEKDTMDIVSPLLHPLRSDATITSTHSYLYGNDDDDQPLCFYEDGETIKTGRDQMPHLIVLSNCYPHNQKLDRVLAHFQEKAKTDPWARKNLPCVKAQIDDIRYSQKYAKVKDYLLQQAGDGCLKKVIAGFVSKPDHVLYQDLLEQLVSFFEKRAKENEGIRTQLENIQKIIKDTAGADSFLQTCIHGRAEVQAYLRSEEALQLIAKAKEKALRRACALGDIDTLRTLLKEGANPNAVDELQRTALHYAAMRPDLVKKELLAAAVETGRPLAGKALEEEIQRAFVKHPLVIKTLQKYATFPLQYDAVNKNGNTTQDILEREIKISTPDIKVIYEACVALMKASQECTPSTNNGETTESNPLTLSC